MSQAKVDRYKEEKKNRAQIIKKEKREENILVGQSVIDAELKKFSKSYSEAQKLEIVTNVAHRIGVQSADDLYNTIGYGGLSISKISLKLHDELDRIVKTEILPSELSVADIPIKKAKNIRSSGGIIVDGEEGCLVKFAKCCNPLPGDDVVGFVTKGYGISIHKKDCPNVIEGMKNSENASRYVEAEWEAGASEQSSGGYEALLQIFAYDSIGILADISMTLADMKVSILSINSQKKSDDMVIINLKISCKNIDHYKSIVSRLKNLKNIEDVTRGFS